MLIQFKCSNFKSIDDEITFSMVASTDDSQEDKLIEFESKKILRTAEIYGANGSGKTTVLQAIHLMQRMVCRSFTYEPDEKLNYKPHKLSNKDVTQFAIWFEKKDIKYIYEFAYNENRIKYEALHYIPNGRTALIFERTEKGVQYGTDFSKIMENYGEQLLDNKLALSVFANLLRGCKEIQSAYSFFSRDIIYRSAGESRSINSTIYFIERFLEPESRQEDLFGINDRKNFISILKQISPDLKGFKVVTSDTAINFEEDSDDDIDERTFRRLHRPEKRLKTIYSKFELDIEDESTGIKMLFAMLPRYLNHLYDGKILLIDEIETSLHPLIVKQLVQLFLDNKKSNAQLIYSTHNTDLLDLDFLRRDQIWFTELQPEKRNTDLYSLYDIGNVRKDENIKKGYMVGKYGAIPILNKNFLDSITEE